VLLARELGKSEWQEKFLVACGWWQERER